MKIRNICLTIGLSLALLLSSVTVLTAGTPTPSDITGSAAAMMDKININTASVDALAKVPGVGDKLAQAISAYRDANGAFSSVADLVNVDGIDAALLDKIKPFLTI